jgi:hypothetical protein
VEPDTLSGFARYERWKGIMKSITMLLLLLSTGLAGRNVTEAQTAPETQVVHVATALDHITVLEFSEPVTTAAAGSSAFNIEWRQNKVLIKPTKTGASTDLFVWTSSRRFTYELDPPGEAKNMNFAVDNPSPVNKPVDGADANARMTEVADMVLTRAFLGADRVENNDIKNDKGHVVIRIENVFQSASSLYIRYSVQNFGERPYRVLKPAVYELSPPVTTISLSCLRHTQLDGRTVQKLGADKRLALVVASAETRKEDIRPGDSTRGVIVLRQQFSAPTALQLVFADAGERHVSATFVF